MNYGELLYRLKEWKRTNPEIMEQPVIFSLSADDSDDSWEVDDLELLDYESPQGLETWEACQSGDIPGHDILILTP